MRRRPLTPSLFSSDGERFPRKPFSRVEPLNLVTAEVTKQTELVLCRIRLITSAATNRRFMESPYSYSRSHWDHEPRSAAFRPQTPLPAEGARHLRKDVEVLALL